MWHSIGLVALSSLYCKWADRQLNRLISGQWSTLYVAFYWAHGA